MIRSTPEERAEFDRTHPSSSPKVPKNAPVGTGDGEGYYVMGHDKDGNNLWTCNKKHFT